MLVQKEKNKYINTHKKNVQKKYKEKGYRSDGTVLTVASDIEAIIGIAFKDSQKPKPSSDVNPQ